MVLHNLDSLHEPIESAISNYLGQSVKIAEINSAWSGNYLEFYFDDVDVTDIEKNSTHYAQVKHIAAKLDAKSLLYFWPNFTDISIEQPKVTIESFADGSFRFAGKRYQPSKNQQIRSAWLFNWLLTQKSADMHDGEFLWKHREGKQTKVENISVRYRYQNEQRNLYAVGQNDKNALGMSATIRGNFILEGLWDAQAAFLSGSNIKNLENLNAELLVEQGQGVLKLQEFKVQRLIDIVNIFGQGSGLQRWLAQSQLTGNLNDIALNFTGPVTSLKQWKFQALANKIAWKPSKNIPGLSALDLKISIDQQQGKLSFNSQNSILQWPKQLKQAMAINELSGTLSIHHQSDDVKLEIHEGRIDTPIVQATDITGFLRKEDVQDIYLDLQSQIKTENLRNMEQYFPLLIKEQFRDWWNNAMPEKQIAYGDVSYKGLLNREDFFSGKSKLNAILQTKKASLDYGFKQDWPVFTAEALRVDWQNDALIFSGIKPKVGNVDISNPKAKLTRMFHRDRLLTLQGQVSGDLTEVVEFLQNGPLISPEVKRQRSPNRIDIHSVTGRFTSQLDISLPLNEINAVSLYGQGEIIDGSVFVGDFLPIENIQGQVNYTEKDVTGQDIQAEVLGGSAKVNVKTLVPGKQLKVRLGAEGTVDISLMQQLISPQLANRFQGKSTWAGFVEIDGRGVNVAMESDLLGTELAFPQPFGKSGNEAEDVSVSFQAGRDQESQLQVRSKEFNLQFESIERKNLLDRGLIFVGDEPTQKFSATENDRTEILPAEGIHIVATEVEMNIDEWLQDIQEMTAISSGSQGNKPFNEHLKMLHIEPKELIIFGKNLGETDFIAKSDDGLDWSLEIEGQYASGVGKMTPFAANMPAYEFTFDRLHWPSEKELLARDIIIPDKKQDNDVGKPNTYPDVDIQVRNLRIFDKDFNRLSFKASANETAWQFQEITLSASGIDINATGQWFDNGSRNGMTKIVANVSSIEGGKSLAELGFGNFLEGGEIKIDSSIFWRGAPAHFSFDRLNGDYNLDIRNGSFPKVDAESGRFFGLLNINALSRRLRLDFGDVFGKGLVFDSIKTQGIFNDGDIVLKDFYVLSPSVYVEAQGKIGLEREDYDLQMLVSPQLGGNVALLAAISNPAAGAVVWLVDRIFKNQLNKVIIYTYDIAGSWSDPKVNRVIRDNSDDESIESLN